MKTTGINDTPGPRVTNWPCAARSVTSTCGSSCRRWARERHVSRRGGHADAPDHLAQALRLPRRNTWTTPSRSRSSRSTRRQGIAGEVVGIGRGSGFSDHFPVAAVTVPDGRADRWIALRSISSSPTPASPRRSDTAASTSKRWRSRRTSCLRAPASAARPIWERSWSKASWRRGRGWRWVSRRNL